MNLFWRLFILSFVPAFLILSAKSGLAAELKRSSRAPLSQSGLIQFLRTWESELVTLKHTATNTDAFETDLRRELILRLRFQVERRYTGDDASLRRILIFIQELEEKPDNRSLSYLNGFLSQLVLAVDQVRERTESLPRFIRQFTETSTIQSPMTVDEFSESRAYLNAYETEEADIVTDETWAQLMDRIQSSEAEAQPVAKPLAQEAAEPLAQETAEPLAQETAEPLAQETAEPLAQETAEPSAQAPGLRAEPLSIKMLLID